MSATNLLLALVVLVGFTVESALGFGATVVTVTLGSMLASIDDILVAFVPVNVLLSGTLVARNYAHVDRALLLRKIVPFMAPGLPLGFWLGRRAPPHLLKGVFGVFVVALAALELGRAHRSRRAARLSVGVAGMRSLPPPALRAPDEERPLGLAATAALLGLGGVVHGAFTTGGPMAVYVSGRLLPDKARFRATLSALWLVLNSAIVAGHLARGSINAHTLPRSAAMLFALPLGVAFGEWLHRRVPVPVFRVAINALLLVIGAVLVARSALA